MERKGPEKDDDDQDENAHNADAEKGRWGEWLSWEWIMRMNGTQCGTATWSPPLISTIRIRRRPTWWPGCQRALPPSPSPAPSLWRGGSRHWRPPARWRWWLRLQAVGLRCSGKRRKNIQFRVVKENGAPWHKSTQRNVETYLHTYREIVFLDPLKVERLVDFHICVRPAVVLPLLQVERVVLVRLVRRASDQLVEYGWVVFYARAGWGK